MNWARTFAAVVALAGLIWAGGFSASGQTSSARKAPAKKTTAKKAAKKAPARKSTARKSRVRRRAPARPPSQRAPSAERIRQIQQALAERGHFTDAPDGKWGASSEEAMKRFQAEQNLQPTGKITSLSLIGLGLGPKYDNPPPTGTAESQ
ncbi:MAG: peptidoglycan-binding protein [Bryobacterales bacterium]|jgi:peptidoglycan hydrolase-like protein with peptidoglycan-binding domain|nr:peptidoglycan-binding protein [Bryobacterales bacterium]